MAVDFDNRFQSFRNDNFAIALTLWRIVRYSFGAHRVKIVSYSSISDVIAEPNIEEVQEIKMVVD